MRIGELEAEIVVDGQPLREYDDTDFDQEPLENHMSKYIEAMSGSRFDFRCKVHPGYEFAPAIDYLQFRCFIDGRFVRGKVVTAEHIMGSNSHTTTADGFVSFHNEVRMVERFRFDALKMQGTYSVPLAIRCIQVLSAHTDGQITHADFVRQKEMFSGVGQLKVEVWRRVGGPSDKRSGTLGGPRDLSNIHEKSVSQKAVTLTTKYYMP